MAHIENIVVGKPIVDLWQLLGKDKEDTSFMETTVFEEERFLPRILAKHGIMKSASEVRRNRPDLVKDLNELDFLEIKIGKRKIWVVVGLDSDTELEVYFKENE